MQRMCVEMPGSMEFTQFFHDLVDVIQGCLHLVGHLLGDVSRTGVEADLFHVLFLQIQEGFDEVAVDEVSGVFGLAFVPESTMFIVIKHSQWHNDLQWRQDRHQYS